MQNTNHKKQKNGKAPFFYAVVSAPHGFLPVVFKIFTSESEALSFSRLQATKNEDLNFEIVVYKQRNAWSSKPFVLKRFSSYELNPMLREEELVQ